MCKNAIMITTCFSFLDSDFSCWRHSNIFVSMQTLRFLFHDEGLEDGHEDSWPSSNPYHDECQRGFDLALAILPKQPKTSKYLCNYSAIWYYNIWKNKDPCVNHFPGLFTFTLGLNIFLKILNYYLLQTKLSPNVIIIFNSFLDNYVYYKEIISRVRLETVHTTDNGSYCCCSLLFQPKYIGKSRFFFVSLWKVVTAELISKSPDDT